MSAPTLAKRHSCVAPGASRYTGLTCPFTVRVVGASLLMLVLTIESPTTWVSLSTNSASRHVTARQAAALSSSPSITIRPDRPPKTCSSEDLCWCEWYQNVPEGWLAGIFTS